MKTFLTLLKLDIKLLIKYNLLTVSLVLALIYILVFLVFNVSGNYPLINMFIFSDPAMFGFIFIGVLVLYEKGQHTLQALSVCPVNFEYYLWSKTISLTLMALPICFAIIFTAHGFYFNYLAFLSAVVFSSVLFVLLGFIGVTRVQTFNQYIIVIPMFFLPAVIPLLDLFHVYFHPLFYLIPSYAGILLFRATFEEISLFQWIYSIIYLLIWIIGARYYAIKSYKKYILIN